MEPKNDEELLRYKAKAVLRQRASALRRTIPKEAISERSGQICERVANLPEVIAARTAALFYPMENKHEVDLRPLDAVLRDRNVRVAYPTINGETRVMTFRFTNALSDVAMRDMMFAEPPHDAEEAEALDVIVVPALQVDGAGHRIGYGAGFYDRTLVRYLPGATAIIVAFDFQLISEVPVTEGDIACPFIITDKRILRVSSV
ncbi:MAG: 5-formyltetrahydrofolate cyclo-ligase [Polyangiaceae bacterium]|nr:5-formyltetrahydrofolate cyclo-ligase [Polyangiaceae bacterium]